MIIGVNKLVAIAYNYAMILILDGFSYYILLQQSCL